jgi:hypothetical protein
LHRGSELDQWKLDNWSDFSRSLVKRELKWNIPASSVLYFDNSKALDNEALDILQKFIYGTVS